jgi:predicted lysophospholipase L1 biosynthesis ABC-type transport system permease subunit
MAAPTAGSPGPPSSNGVIPAEWPVQAADTIVETIGKVRDKTTKPALTAARALVYGLLGAIVGTVAGVLALVLVVRLYENYVPGNVWPLYAGLAVVMLVVGTILLKRATRPAAAPT